MDFDGSVRYMGYIITEINLKTDCNNHIQVFYVRYRLGLGYPWADQGSTTKQAKQMNWTTKEEWDAVGASKMNRTIQLVNHLKRHPRIANPTFDATTGEGTWPEPPTDVQPGDMEARKIIMFSEFVRHSDALINVSEILLDY